MFNWGGDAGEGKTWAAVKTVFSVHGVKFPINRESREAEWDRVYSALQSQYSMHDNVCYGRAGSFSVRNNGKYWHLDNQDSKLIRLVYLQTSLESMARQLGRQPSAIWDRLKKLTKNLTPSQLNELRSGNNNMTQQAPADFPAAPEANVGDINLQITMAELVDATIPDLKFYTVEDLSPSPRIPGSRLVKSLITYANGDTVLVDASGTHSGTSHFVVLTITEIDCPQPASYSDGGSVHWIISAVDMKLWERNKKYELEVAKAISNKQRSIARESVLQQITGGLTLPSLDSMEEDKDSTEVVAKGEKL